MQIQRSILPVLVVSAVGCQATAQIPATRPDAATIVAGMTAQGHTSGWDSYADFVGCPQDDAVGAEVLDLIDGDAAVADAIVGGLMQMWSDEYGTCGYGVLDAWFLDSLTELVEAGSYHADVALLALPPTLGAQLEARVRTILANASAPASRRADLATEAIRRLGPPEQEATFLEYLQAPGLPADWVSSWSGFFTNEFGAAYVDRLAQASSTIDDETLFAAIGTVLTGTALGTVAGNDRALANLADAIAARPGLQGSFETVDRVVATSSVQLLIDGVNELVARGDLAEEHGAGPLSVLGNALTAVTTERPSAPALVGAFMSQIEGLVAGGQLRDVDGQPLIDDAALAIELMTR